MVGESAAHPAASSGASAAPAGSAPPRSVRFSNEQLKKLRSNCENGMELATRVLSMFENRAVVVGAAALIGPIKSEHGLALTEMKTIRGTEEWRVAMATGRRCAHFHEAFAKLSSSRVLLDVGLLHWRHGAEAIRFSAEEAGRICTSMVNVCRESLYREAAFQMSYSWDLPGRFAGMLSHLASERAATSKWIKSVFAAVSAAETAALTDPWVQSFLCHVLGSVVVSWPSVRALIAQQPSGGFQTTHACASCAFLSPEKTRVVRTTMIIILV